MGTIARRATAVAASIFVLATTLVAVPLAAHAADNGSWAAYPVRAGNNTTPRQYFFFDVGPGSTIRDKVTLTNAKPFPKRLRIYASDAYNVRAGGGFALNAVDAKNTGVGSWITLPVDTVTIPARHKITTGKNKGTTVDGRLTVPFTMQVPRNASPGDHAGGIVTLETSASSTIGQPGSVAVGVERALGVRIYTRVTGPLNPQLLVTSVRYIRSDAAVMPFLGNQGGATIVYTYTNPGNERLSPLTTITYKGLLGRTIHSVQAATPEILPGATITLTNRVSGMPVLDQVTAKVSMKGDSALDPNTASVSAAGTTGAWFISWIFVGVLVALVIGFMVWRRRRSGNPGRRGKRARPEPEPAAMA